MRNVTGSGKKVLPGTVVSGRRYVSFLIHVGLLFDRTGEKCVQDILRRIVVEAAVVVVYFVADKGIVSFKQGVNDRQVSFAGDAENKTFIYFADIPMAGNGISGGGNIVEGPFGNVSRRNEVFADGIHVVAVVNVGQIIYFRDRGSAERIDDGGPFVFGLSGDIVDQTAGEKQIVCFLVFSSGHFCFPFLLHRMDRVTL